MVAHLNYTHTLTLINTSIANQWRSYVHFYTSATQPYCLYW